MYQQNKSLTERMNGIKAYVAPLAITAFTAACAPMLNLNPGLLDSKSKPVTYQWKGPIDDKSEQIVYDTIINAMPELVAEMKKKNVPQSTIDSLVVGVNKKDASDVGYALLAAEQHVSGTFETMGKYKITVGRYVTPEGYALAVLFVAGAVKFLEGGSTGTTTAKKASGGGA